MTYQEFAREMHTLIADERARLAAMLPPGACCERCAEDDPLVLISATVLHIRCFDCDAIARGLEPFEEHHIAGRAHGPWTVRVSCNMHRRLTVRQRLRAALIHRLGQTARA